MTGLKDNATSFIASTAPPGYLSNQLSSSLFRTKIQAVKTRVRVQDSHEGDVGEMVAFSQHLGAHENVGISRPNIR